MSSASTTSATIFANASSEIRNASTRTRSLIARTACRVSCRMPSLLLPSTRKFHGGPKTRHEKWRERWNRDGARMKSADGKNLSKHAEGEYRNRDAPLRLRATRFRPLEPPHDLPGELLVAAPRADRGRDILDDRE